MSTMLRNKSDYFTSSHQLNKPNSILNSKKIPTYITLSDFMRIQNEINPVNSEFENRKAYNSRLKGLSQTKSKYWPDSIEMKKKNRYEFEKKRFLEEEERKRRIDLEEKKYKDLENDQILKRAQKVLFDEQDPVKTFNMKLMYCDILKERDYQKEIKKRKQEINNAIEKQFFDIDKKRMEEMDKIEKEKELKEQEKKKQRMKIVNEQLHEYKIKLIQDYQEKQVEGELMKLQMKKALEDEEKQKKILEKKKQEQRKEYIESNKRLMEYKEIQKQKEIIEDKKIQEFLLKKEQLEEVKKKVLEDKEKEKQKQRDKLEKIQFEYFSKLKKNENEILERNIKEADEKKNLEEKRKKEKRDKILKEIKEQMIADKERKEQEKIKNKEEDMKYIDDYKMKLNYLESQEK